MTEVAEPALDIWRQLEQVLTQRLADRPAGSYVTELLNGGHPVLAGKVVEEAYELVEACGEDDRAAILHEAADLAFHVLILLRTHDIRWSEVETQLAERFGVSGLAEKASRLKVPRD